MELVLFCDYGLDDAAATADVLAHAAADGWERVVLAAVGGNVPPEISLRNAKKLVAQTGMPVPVLILDTTGEPQPAEYLAEIHGKDGMGDLFPDAECPAPVLPFAEWERSAPRAFALLSLGPMTLVPRALARKPEKFVFMGGNLAEEPNFRGFEFNHALNRDAFSACVKYPHVAVTMDTCRDPRFNIQGETLRTDTLLGKIVARARELTFSSGEKGCYIWDDIAVKYLRHPDWFELYEGTDRDGNRLTVARYLRDAGYARILAG